MAKTEITVRGYVYTVTSPNGGTVTDAEGKLNKSVEAGDQVTVTAPSSSLTCDDDDAVICKANFKQPLLALRLLGQGEKALPAGYTRAEFLESTGTQRINTGLPATNLTCVEVDFGDVKNASWATPVATLTPYGAVGYVIFAKGSSGVTSDVPRFDYGSSILVEPNYDVSVGRHAMKKEANRNFIDGVEVTQNAESGDATWAELCLLYFRSLNKFMSGKLYNYAKWELGGAVQQNFIPALDPNGRPCMFDTVTKKPFHNSGTGQFIVGFTLAQAAQLGRKLPSTGGSLALSLPEGYDMDERVVNSLAEAEAKGWVLTIQTYAAETSAATFALRRVWVRREQAEHGSYVAADGSRWQVEWCVDVIGADPESLGYERFRSVEAAVAYWELAPYVNPEAMDEPMGDNGTLEQEETENTSPETNS